MKIAHLFVSLALSTIVAACLPAVNPDPQDGAARAGPPPVDEIMDLLASRDFTRLAAWVGEDGLLLSPYLTIEPTSLRLSADEIAQCATQRRVREWGIWDGRGDPIRLTCAQYFDRLVWVADFRSVRPTIFDRPLAGGLDKDNHRDLFPGAVVAWRYRPEYRDAKGVHHPWQSLHLVFHRRGDAWRLAAIVRGTRVI